MSCFVPDLQDELTDIFSERTEELYTTVFTSTEHTRPFSDEAAPAEVAFRPFSCGDGEHTEPLPAALIQSEHLLRSDDDVDDLKAMVRRVATTELRNRRPRRVRTRS